MNEAHRLEKHLLAKGAAGLVLGFAIALGLSGLFVFASPGDFDAYAKYEVAMWAVVPPWLLILSFSFLFASGWRAWAWLGGASLVVHGALVACRHWL